MLPFEIATGPYDMPQRLVSARGELDIASAATLLAAVRAAVAHPGATGVRLDLDGITFIDSVGIAALIQINQIATGLGGGLDISGSSAAVRLALRLMGLGEMFGLEPERHGELSAQ